MRRMMRAAAGLTAGALMSAVGMWFVMSLALSAGEMSLAEKIAGVVYLAGMPLLWSALQKGLRRVASKKISEASDESLEGI